MMRLLCQLTACFFAAAAMASGCARPPGDSPEPASGGAVAAGEFPDGWAFPASSVVRSAGRSGMVASTDSIASAVGVAVLRRGGNGVDAAIATHFALAVVNPEAGNLGGGGFMVVRTASGEIAALDFREKAPLAARPDMFLDARGELTDRSVVGHLASGVPGSVAGMWEAHRRFGSLPWEALLQPAIELAGGLTVHPRLGESLRSHANQLESYPATASIFLPGGRPPAVGERFSQVELRGTLERIASAGRDGFYQGRTAELIAAEMERGGGIITLRDLADYQAIWRPALVFDYRGYRIITIPPPSSGGATLAETLNILEGFDLRSAGFMSPRHVHLWGEAVKRAFADRNAYLADPDFIPQPTERMISDGYAAERRSTIVPDRATSSASVLPGLGPVPGGSVALVREGDHTTHFSVVDRAGMAVAVTTTLNSLYGSLVTVAGAGFLLNNEMDDFSARPGSPNQFGLVQGAANAIQPGKRMLSAMTPVIVIDGEGRLRLVTGSPGGPTIITTVAQLISNIVDFGMDIVSATAAPRMHHQHLPDVIRYEQNGMRPEVVEALAGMGHQVEERYGYSGDTQSVQLLPDGTMVGVSDPRRGGAAIAVEAN